MAMKPKGMNNTSNKVPSKGQMPKNSLKGGKPAGSSAADIMDKVKGMAYAKSGPPNKQTKTGK